MKTTDPFKATIQNYLDETAAKDPLFAETLKKEKKNIDDCCTYILNQVKASGCVGFEDEEIYGMAIHYYDEDDIKVGDKISAKVVVNHQVTLTDEEKAAARQKAMDVLIEEEKEKLAKTTKVKLTPAEKEEAKEMAKQISVEEAINEIQQKRIKKAEKKKPEAAAEQSSLFE